jgi:hypothetical protein
MDIWYKDGFLAGIFNLSGGFNGRNELGFCPAVLEGLLF